MKRTIQVRVSLRNGTEYLYTIKKHKNIKKFIIIIFLSLFKKSKGS